MSEHENTGPRTQVCATTGGAQRTKTTKKTPVRIANEEPADLAAVHKINARSGRDLIHRHSIARLFGQRLWKAGNGSCSPPDGSGVQLHFKPLEKLKASSIRGTIPTRNTTVALVSSTLRRLLAESLCTNLKAIQFDPRRMHKHLSNSKRAVLNLAPMCYSNLINRIARCLVSTGPSTRLRRNRNLSDQLHNKNVRHDSNRLSMWTCRRHKKKMTNLNTITTPPGCQRPLAANAIGGEELNFGRPNFKKSLRIEKPNSNDATFNNQPRTKKGNTEADRFDGSSKQPGKSDLLSEATWETQNNENGHPVESKQMQYDFAICRGGRCGSRIAGHARKMHSARGIHLEWWAGPGPPRVEEGGCATTSGRNMNSRPRIRLTPGIVFTIGPETPPIPITN